MHSFLTLTGFEYKKIFKRKSSIVALVLGVIAICASPLPMFFMMSYIDGEPYENHYEAMVKERAYALALSGRMVDAGLFGEMQDAYAMIPAIERYEASPEYQAYARPYNRLFWLLNREYGYGLDLEGLASLTADDFRAFYQTRHDNVVAGIRAGAISDAAKERLIALNSVIETPYVYAHTDGFNALFGYIYTLGIICAFILAKCLAPMFADEYATGADQLLLTAKHGKGRLIAAKLCAALSLFVLYFLLLLALAYIMCSLVYGYDGAAAPVQLIMPFLAYPLSVAGAVGIFAACAFGGVFLFVAITLLLSSRLRSPFGVIIVVSVLLFVPMMVSVPETAVWLWQIFTLLPSGVMTQWHVFSHVPFDFFGLIALPYVVLPVYAFLAGAMMLPFTWRGFRRHQIG